MNVDYASHGFFDDLKKKISIKDILNETLIKTHWIVGCTIIINLDKFENKNLFDENYFLFFEEFDLCRRVLKKDGKIFVSKNLFVKHLGHKGSQLQ